MIIISKIYSKEYLKNLLINENLEILGEIKTSNDKVLCKTVDNYYVLVIPIGIISRGDKPSIFSKYNPYTIINIKQWIKNNNLTLELLDDTYFGTNSKMEWKCECGKIFSTTWSTILGGKKYCNFCSRSKRYDANDYNYLVQEKCVELGYTLLPDQDIKRSNTKFYYICDKHKDYGAQYSYPDNFITDYGNGGCYQCCIEKRSESKRKPEEFFKKLTEDAGMIFCGVKYSKDDRTKIIYKCPNHLNKGEIECSVANMKANSGRCPYCVGKKRTINDLQAEIDLLESHVEILEFEDYGSPIKVKCTLCGHEWITTGVNLTQGHSCPNCNQSKFEINVKKWLDSNNIENVQQYKFKDCRDIKPLPFDFYLPKYNLLIEVDGEGHYFPIKRSSYWTKETLIKNFNYIKKHDDIKTNYCKDNNIRLIRVPYWERDNLNNYLLGEIKNFTNLLEVS